MAALSRDDTQKGWSAWRHRIVGTSSLSCQHRGSSPCRRAAEAIWTQPQEEATARLSTREAPGCTSPEHLLQRTAAFGGGHKAPGTRPQSHKGQQPRHPAVPPRTASGAERAPARPHLPLSQHHPSRHRALNVSKGPLQPPPPDVADTPAPTRPCQGKSRLHMARSAHSPCPKFPQGWQENNYADILEFIQVTELG